MSLYTMPESLVRETMARAEEIRQKPLVKLRCPKCKATSVAVSDATDPPGTALIHLHCPECNDGDFDEPLYFDVLGSQLGLSE